MSNGIRRETGKKPRLPFVTDPILEASSPFDDALLRNVSKKQDITNSPPDGVALSDYELVASSDLFDSKWYLESNRDVALAGADPVHHYLHFGAAEGRNPSRKFNTQRYVSRSGATIPFGMNPLIHYIRYGTAADLVDVGMLDSFQPNSIATGMKRLEAFPLFSEDDYLSLNADVAGSSSNCVNHAMAYGFSEGRNVFHKNSVARILGEVSREPIAAPIFSQPKTRKLPPIGIFYNTEGNGFIHELAADLVQTLVDAGQDVMLLNEGSDKSARPALCIFMGPHEFFHIGGGPAWVTDDIIRNAVMFNTEQPQTLWFERGMPFNLLSAGVIDICYQISRMFNSAGIPTIHFNRHLTVSADNLLTKEDLEHPMFKVLPKMAQSFGSYDSPLRARPIDVAFFGTASAHREAFFLRAASFLADRECYIYYRKFNGPLLASNRDSILARLPDHVAKHSKILLNIHRDDFGFFEWHRIAKQGMACGSIIVSEPCLPHPCFKPNVHFFEESARQIPNLIEWLLNSNEGADRAEEMRKTVASLMKNKKAATRSVTDLICFLADVVEARS